jgi:hypothetical protein
MNPNNAPRRGAGVYGGVKRREKRTEQTEREVNKLAAN